MVREPTDNRKKGVGSASCWTLTQSSRGANRFLTEDREHFAPLVFGVVGGPDSLAQGGFVQKAIRV